MVMVRTRLFAVVAAVAVLMALAPLTSADAHTGASLCHGEFVNDGHGAGRCELPFQGFPIGVLGSYDSGDVDGTAPAQIHVEVFAKTLDGQLRPLGIECEDSGSGSVRCESEDNPLGQPVTTPEPAPSQIAHLVCTAHSHAKVEDGTEPVGQFACWSTEEAREALVEDGFERPSDGEPDAEPDDGLAVPTEVTPLLTTVPVNTYAPSTVVTTRESGLDYVNLDANRHDVVALDATRPDGSAEWCANYDAGSCPLFWTPLTPTGGEAPVLGLDDAVAGEDYAFFCTIHPYMVGTITVVA